MKKPLIILTGPTAAGKTALSVRLAQEIRGEIISADSMQVYRGMDIGTAKVTEAEKGGVPHHLIDVLDPREPFSVCAFRRMAKAAVARIHENGHVPILVGGTGFYIQSVLYDIDFDDNAEETTLRETLQQEFDALGAEQMHRRLRAIDPEAAAAIHPNNRKRVLRAIAFYQLTGKKISQHNREQRRRESPYEFLYYVLTMERQALYRRIELRVDRMMADGLLEEVKALRDRGMHADLTSMQGIGYRQIFDYLDGIATIEEAVERIKRETRHFAKRQLTWFRREPDAIWLCAEDFGNDRGRMLKRMKAESAAMLTRCRWRPGSENMGSVSDHTCAEI